VEVSHLKTETVAELVVVAFVPFIMVLGNSMLIPVLPTMRQVMHLTQVQTGLIITSFSIPAAVVIGLAGYLADRYGRKAVIVPSLIVYGAGGLIAAGAAVLARDPYIPLIAGRIVQGVGAAGTAPIAMALAGDIFRTGERTQALGILESANGLGKVASPLLGSLAALIAWYAPFVVYGVLAFPIAFGVWKVVHEPDRSQARMQSSEMGNYFQSLKAVFSHKGGPLLASYFCGMVVLFILFGLLFYISDTLETTFAVDGVLRGAIVAIPVLVMAVASYVTGAATQRKPPTTLKILVIAGLGLVGVGCSVAAFLRGALPSLVAAAGVGLGTGVVLPPVNTLVTGTTSGAQRGIVTSGWGATRFTGVALGPPLFGVAMQLGRPALLLGTAGLAGLALLVGLVFLDANRLLAGWQKGQGMSDGGAP
jgi:ACDE family multidrug resistance protein